MNTEPQDAIPAEAQPAPAKPSFEERVAPIRWRNFRTGGKIVGVHISEDGTEIWSHGFGKPHYPVAGARCTYEERNGVLVFETPDYELPITVPKNARKYARKFAAEFNTWQKSGTPAPPKA